MNPQILRKFIKQTGSELRLSDLVEEAALEEVTFTQVSSDKEFTVYWRDGKRSIVKGPTIHVAFARAGYSAGAVAAIDWYDNGNTDTHNWASETRTWIRKTPMLQS